jgi:hypothetical protein
VKLKYGAILLLGAGIGLASSVAVCVSPQYSIYLIPSAEREEHPR